MTAIAELSRRSLGLASRLAGRLLDPARREREAVLVLAAYTLLWTLYGAVSKSAQDSHFDMVEVAGWARDPALGYPKHPPLAAYLAGSWFSIFPQADWAYDLLAVAVAAVTLWIAWRLAADYLDPARRVAALAMLTLVPFFNFHALKYNVNTVLLPVWAATALFFLRSFETRRPVPAALAGLFAAAAILGKYWSVFLLLGLGLAALFDRRRAAYFGSPAPWITVAAGLLALGPHLVWLMTHDFLPFGYAVAVHGAHSAWAVLRSVPEYFGGAAAYVALPVLLAVAALRPNRDAWSDILRPQDATRRLAANAFWWPLLLPALVAPVAGLRLTSLWTMPAFALLPVVLLSSPRVALTRQALDRLVLVAMAFPLVMLLLAAPISVVVHRKGVSPPAEAQASLLAPEVEKLWRATTGRPLRIVGGDGDTAYGTAFYLPDRPSVFANFNLRESPWISAARIARDGIAMVCRQQDLDCLRPAAVWADKSARTRRIEVTVARSHFGVAGKPERYVIFAVPPG